MMLPFNKVINYRTIILFLAGIAIVACKSNFAILTIENAQPASEELPNDIQSLTLMNRSMNHQFMNHREDSLQRYFFRNGYQLSRIVLDSTAADTTITALAALLFESGRYDVVVPLERNISRRLSYEKLPDTLSLAQVSKICADYKTDALMVLERFSTKLMSDYTKYQAEANSNNYSFYATLDLKYNAFFRIYRPDNKTLVREIDITDTISWESSDDNQARMFGRIPSIKQAMINAGIKIALDIDDKLSPTWISEKRGYFLFNSMNDKGQQFMNENNYQEAEKYWTEMAQSPNKRIRSKAEYNLALIDELNGNLDGAIEWGLKSFYSYYRYQTEIYIKKLQARKIALQKTE